MVKPWRARRAREGAVLVVVLGEVRSTAITQTDKRARPWGAWGYSGGGVGRRGSYDRGRGVVEVEKQRKSDEKKRSAKSGNG